MNSKVNNWAVEILPFRITFKYIKGIKNTLANTMSRLIDIDPQIQQDSEPEGYEFGYYTFDTLPAMEVSNIDTTHETSSDNGKEFNGNLVNLPLTDKTLSELQEQDTFCSNILVQIKKGNIKEGQTYKIQNNLLKRYVTDGDKTYETVILPRALTAQILKMAHDDLGHNGTHRTYMLLKRLYYWKGLKPSVTKHIQRCYHCQRRNKQVVKYATLHFDVATFPMQFISMDLIGEFHPPTSKGKKICIDHYLYAYRLCVLYSTKNQNC